jgi:outer membrane receptor protein involved in Fe transport
VSQGIREASPANPTITWEKAKKTDVGFELSIFKGLFSIEADYFFEKRNDILIANQTRCLQNMESVYLKPIPRPLATRGLI